MKKLLILFMFCLAIGACSKEEEKPLCEETGTGTFCVTNVRNQTLQMKLNGGLYGVLEPGEKECYELVKSQAIILSFETVVTGNAVGDDVNFFLEVCEVRNILF